MTSLTDVNLNKF